MLYTKEEVLQYVEENDVKFIKMVFCDVAGNMKNLSLFANELSSAFEYGVYIKGSALGQVDGPDDVLLFPNPSTMALLPWRPQRGRVVRMLCDIKNPDGNSSACDTRQMLKAEIKEIRKKGYEFKAGLECEFYLFKLDDNGEPTYIPHDAAGAYAVAPLDKGENVRRDICLSLEEMGFDVQSSHHENGPGQNEIDFKSSSVLETVDNFITFKQTVKTVSFSDGLFASFLPKPLAEKPGNGMRIGISLYKDGKRLIADNNGELEPTVESFAAGVLAHIEELTAFLNPIPMSYDRLSSKVSPSHISWSHKLKNQLMRIPTNSSHVYLRSPDAFCNPYAAFTLILKAGFEGIEKSLKLPEEEQESGYLPTSLSEALKIAENSEFIKASLPTEFLDGYYKHIKALCADADCIMSEKESDAFRFKTFCEN